MNKDRRQDSALAVILPAFLTYISIQIYYFLCYTPPSYVLPLTWDKLGYYLYLPAAFIYHDLLHLGFITGMIQKYELSAYFYQAHVGHTGNYVLSYTLGLSILEFPFFCIGHLMAHLLGYPADGFSLPYQFCITLGGTFYAMAGLYFLYRTLLYFFDEKISVITLLIIVFSTNYFYYSVFENGMAHTYLFTLYAIVLYYTKQWHDKPKYSYAAWLGLAMGMAIVIRPSEIVILLIPILWAVYDRRSAIDKFQLVFKNYRHVLLLCFIAMAPGLLQVVY
jgi:hypothetical protein